MMPYLRQKKILDIIYKNEVVSIELLQNNLQDISASTLRRDLKKLEQEGKIILLGGGAVKIALSSEEIPVSVKENVYFDEKQSIAELANEIVEEGDVVYLDSGTTCSVLFEKIARKKITIITSNTNIFKSNLTIKAEIILLGGNLNYSLSSLNGEFTNENIKKFNYDKAFIGANGIDTITGIVSTPSIAEASKKMTVISQAKNSYLLCDSSKFNKHFMTNAFKLDKCIVISDKLDEEILKFTKMITPKSK